MSKQSKNEGLFVKPKNELKTKKMRAEICYRLVSVFLSYDQYLGGKRPEYCKHVFQYFVTKRIIFDSL